MSSSIDERVVRVSLDNKEFKSETDKTISSLDKLKRAFKMEGAETGFDQVTEAAKKVNLSPISDGIQQINVQFNAMTTVADAALRNLTNSAINYGERLVKSLSIDQVTAGYSKFEEKTRSVATLLSQGFDLSTINEQLDRLNWFTDETSYNFTDMVSNISKFTATGRGLEDSTTALEGVALWAALSGQNAQTASHAMYQLSQAMGSGTMRLEDWRSIQNASMDTDEFRQKALDAAVALGTLEKVGDDAYRSLVNKSDTFNKSQFASVLTEGAWFTSDVMMRVFQDYSAAVDQIYEYAEEKGISASQAIEELGDKVDQFGLKALLAGQEARTWGDAIDSVKDAVSTGWMKTFEYIIGDSKEATGLFTDLANSLYDVFVESGNARNEMLSQWKELGGREDLFDGLYKAGSNFLKVLDGIKEAIAEVFPPITATRLVALTNAFTDFIYKLEPSKRAIDSIQNAVKGILYVVRFIIDVFKTFAKATSPIFDVLNRLAGTVLGLIGIFGQFTQIAIDKLVDIGALDAVYNVINKISTAIATLMEYGLDTFISLIVSMANSVSVMVESFRDGEGGISGFFDAIVSGINNLFSPFDIAGEKANGFVESVGSGFQIVVSTISGILAFASGFVKELLSTQTQAEGIISEIAGMIARFFNWVANAIVGLDAIDFTSIGMFAAFTYLVINLGSISKALKGVFTSLSETIESFKKKNISEGLMSQLSKFADNTKILQIGISITLLVNALMKLANLPTDQLIQGIISLGGVMAGLVILIKQMESVSESVKDPKAFSKITTSIIITSVSLNILASAVSKLGEMDFGSATQGVIALGLVMTELMAFMKIAEQSDKLDASKWMKMALSVTVLTTAIGLIMPSVLILGTMDLSSLGIALLGLGGILTEIIIFSKLVEGLKAGSVLAAASAITIMSGGILAISIAVKTLGSMEIGEAATGVIAIAGILTALTAACVVLSKTIKAGGIASLVAASAAIVSLSGALMICGTSVMMLGGMTGEDFIQGLLGTIALIGTLTIAMVALGALGTGSAAGLLASSVALLAIGVSITTLAAGVALLSQCPIDIVTTNLFSLAIALAGIITVAAVAGTVGGPGLLIVAGAMLAIAGAAAIFAASVFSISEAIALLVATVTTLGLAGQEFGDEFPSVIQTGLDSVEAIIRGFLQMLPNLSADFAFAVTALVTSVAVGIAMGIPAIIQATLAVATALCEVIARLGGPLMQALTDMVNTFTIYLPDLVTALSVFIDTLFDQVGNLLWDAVVSLIINTIGKPIVGLIGLLNQDIADEFEYGMERMHTDAYKSAKGIVDQTAKGIDDNKDKVEKSMEGLGEAAKDGYNKPLDPETEMDYFRYSVGNMASQLDLGVLDNLTNFEDGGIDLGNAVGDGFDSTVKSRLLETINSLGDFGGLFGGKTRIKATNAGIAAGDLTGVDLSKLTGKERAALLAKQREANAKADDPFGFNAMMEELGNTGMNSLASGMSSPSSRAATSKAAKSQAQTISSAFSEEIDKLSRDQKLQDKLYKLWQAQNPNASEMEKTAQEIAYQSELVRIKTEEATISQKIYQQTLEAMGESAKETDEAYLAMLDDQIELLNAQNQLSKLQNETSENTADAFTKFSDVVKTMDVNYLLEQGFNTQQIAEAAATMAGVTMPKAVEEAQSNAEDAVGEAAKGTVGAYTSAVTTQISSPESIAAFKASGSMVAANVAAGANESAYLIDNAAANLNSKALGTLNNELVFEGYVTSGHQAPAGYAQGVDENGYLATDSTTAMCSNVLTAANEFLEIGDEGSMKFYEVGYQIDMGMVAGINAGWPAVEEAAREVAAAALAAAMAELGVASPSKEMEEVGMYYDLGFAKGIDDYSTAVVKSADGMIEKVLDTNNKAIDDSTTGVFDTLKDDLDLDSDMKIVVDADEAAKKLSLATRTYTSKKDYGDTSTEKRGLDADWWRNQQQSAAAADRKQASIVSFDKLKDKGLIEDTGTKLEQLMEAAMFRMESKWKALEVDKESEETRNTETIVNLTQNNYSPTALSRVDIYRDTQKMTRTIARAISNPSTRR